MLRLLSHETASCYQRCVGFDALNATYMTTFDLDQKYGAEYHARFIEFLKMIQAENQMVVGGMTDVKGDRSKRPCEQTDPDLFVHIAEKRADGIVLRGAKAHMTGGANSHWVLLMPTLSLREGDEAFAVCCAVPLGAPGVIQIFGRQTNEERKFEGGLDIGNPNYGLVGGETLMIFEDVFVPHEHVFMAGEIDLAGLLVERFATPPPPELRRLQGRGQRRPHRGLRPGRRAQRRGQGRPHQGKAGRDDAPDRDGLVGLGGLLGHGRQNLLRGLLPRPASWPTAHKHNITRHIYEIGRLAHDIAGGVVATMPFEADLRSGEIGALVERIPGRGGRGAHRGAAPGPPSHREHDRRHRPGRVHARGRLAPVPEGHVRPAGQAGHEKEVGQEDRRAGWLGGVWK